MAGAQKLRNDRPGGAAAPPAPPSVLLLAARLKYSSPPAMVALENGQLPTTRQKPELMFRNSGMLRHNVITAAGLLAQPQCWQTTSVHPHDLRFLSWLSSCALAQHSFNRTKNFSSRARSKFNPHPYLKQCGFPHPPRKCGYPQPARVKPLRAGL